MSLRITDHPGPTWLSRRREKGTGSHLPLESYPRVIGVWMNVCADDLLALVGFWM